LAFWNRKKSELKGGRLSLRNDQAHYLMITGVVPPHSAVALACPLSSIFQEIRERENRMCLTITAWLRGQRHLGNWPTRVARREATRSTVLFFFWSTVRSVFTDSWAHGRFFFFFFFS
jgi:hypothetical protein